MTVCWFVGLTTLDVVHRAAGRPGANEKVTATRQDVAAGGPAANAAVTAAALGVRAVLVSALGAGPVAQAARADLDACEVQVHDVAGPDEGFPLPVSSVLVDDATGERSVVSADAALAVAPAPSPGELGALPRPDVVLLDGHHPAIARAVLAYVDGLRPRPRVLLDGGRWRPVFAELLPAADVAALSADFTVPADIAPGATDAAHGALLLGARAAVVTHGADPVEWTDGRDHGSVAVPRVTTRDTLGAGDAFHGALAAALARGAGVPDACAAAVRVASTRVRFVGPRSWLAHVPDVSGPRAAMAPRGSGRSREDG
ncbi:PfkB family carbohydrate kinase [Krasilnikoviella flava]|uniref:Sugar or nucleoside kinase, ribokinase family n=1 Tax=Krasilnikoviella flava TaxID=526729 RepID=A0A1T5J481_9MICO|nr:PfkB family carbohydrate kinase [Krasilnikoviella flava]SKC46092.1 Sugar or nucleoside kinase, ribokinase family [Krasilnikoviella flava]